MSVETPHADWREEQPVIDMHCHVAPEEVDTAVEVMDRIGLSKMVDISPSHGERFDRKLEAFEQYPDRFDLFGGIDFEGIGEEGWVDREVARVEDLIERGAVGIKMHKALGLVHKDSDGELIRVDDDRIAPIIERIGELGGVAAFHISDPKAFFDRLDEDNERWAELSENPNWWWGDREEYPTDWWRLIRQFENVVERHDDTTILGVHWGCAAEEVPYVADIMRENENYIVDIAARVGEIGRWRPDLVHDIFVEHQDRVLFGTDMIVRDKLVLGAPDGKEHDLEDTQEFYDAHWRYFETDQEEIMHPSPIQGDWTVDSVDLPREVLEKFYVENSRKHLGV